MLKTKDNAIKTIKRYYGITRKEAENFYNLMNKEERGKMIDYMSEWLKGQARLSFYQD